MALPDARVLELTDALTRAGADWLALEILQGIHSGAPAEETSESLLQAQNAVRRGKRMEERERAVVGVPPISRQLDGDEQLSWAAAYTLDRFRNVLLMLDASMRHLNAIVFEGHGDLPPGARPLEGSIELQLGEEGPIVTVPNSSSVNAELASLGDALSAWLVQPREGH